MGFLIFNEAQQPDWNFGTMEFLKPNIKDYPGKHIEIKIDNPNLNFAEAKDISKHKGKRIGPEHKQ